MIHFVHNKDGKPCGLWIWRWRIIVLPPGRTKAVFRICDHCGANEALVFCETHAKYVCAECLHWHGRRSYGGEFVLGVACRVMSMSWAQQLHRSLPPKQFDFQYEDFLTLAAQREGNRR